MKTLNRLDAVIRRNRNHIVLDLIGAAFLVVVLLFSSLAFGAELPVLSSNGKAPVAQATHAQTVAGTATAAVSAVVDERLAQR